MFKYTLICCFTMLSLASHALTLDDLRTDAPSCQQSTAKRPKLPADQELPYADVLQHDFNGDGWCDYALGVPYPINSKMNSYWINELMVLGGRKWRPALNGKRKLDESIYPHDDWPTFQLDLTDVHLIYPKTGGTPYVIGLMTGGTFVWERDPNPPHCLVYSTVYRWDESVDTFRRVDETVAQVVVDFYYRFVAKPCKPATYCRSTPRCRYDQDAAAQQGEATKSGTTSKP